MAVGTVAFWHRADGWGAIRAVDRPGIGFVHFSHLRGVTGYIDLIRGQDVEFEWADDFAQDGCQWRVEWVRPMANG
jgi:cold shock CspA family protein